MFYVKYLAVCVIFLLVWQRIDAGKLANVNNKRHDEVLQTYIYESNYEDVQADQATTIYPPLIEEPSNSPSIEEHAPSVSLELQPPKPSSDNSVPQPPETDGIPLAPNAPSGGTIPLYYNPYYGYPWTYQQQYYPQSNMGQQNVYPALPINPQYEGVLVPIQTSMQPTRSQEPSQITLTQSPASQNDGTAPTTSTSNRENSKMPASLSHRNSFDLALLLQAMLPQHIIQLFIIIGNFILNSFSTLAFAGAITSLLCSLTPVCTISFGSIPFGVRKILIDGGEMSSIQRVRRAAEMVTNAIDKYEQIQKGVESLTHSLKQTQRKL